MKAFITFLFSAILIIGIVFFGSNNLENTEYLRIHIRANSNSQIDQAVKYQVKDAVVDYMIPLLAECESKEESIEIVEDNLTNIETVAESVLQANGFYYSANANVLNENFPTRSYGDLTLENGFYDALIVELGEGAGDNWWCVVYPPLCFVNGSSSVSVFKSRIIEIINSFGIKF